MTILNNIHI